TWITSLAERDRVVSVEFSDGSEREYDLVIGADGIFSGVRALALGATPVAYGGQRGSRRAAPSRAPPPHSRPLLRRAGCLFWLLPGGRRSPLGVRKRDGAALARADRRPARTPPPPVRRVRRPGPRLSGVSRIR